MIAPTTADDDHEILTEESARFSLAAARHIVRDLYEYRVWIY